MNRLLTGAALLGAATWLGRTRNDMRGPRSGLATGFPTMTPAPLAPRQDVRVRYKIEFEQAGVWILLEIPEVVYGTAWSPRLMGKGSKQEMLRTKADLERSPYYRPFPLKRH